MADSIACSTPEALAVAVLQLAVREARRRRVADEVAREIGQIVALRFFPRATEVRNPAAWVRVVVRRLVGALRSAGRRSEPWGPQHDLARDPDDAFARRHDTFAVLKRLSVRDRSILSLALAGKSHLEISKRFGVKPRDVGTLLARARRRAESVWATLKLPLSA